MSMLTEIVEAGEEDEIRKDTENGAMEQPAMDNWIWSSTVEVAVAVGKGSSSVQALRWVLENNIVPAGGLLHLLHVQAPLRYIPSPMGHNLPIESVSEDMANKHKMQRFLATEQLLYQFKKMCDDKLVNAEVCYAEGDVIHKELVGQVSSLCVAKLIVGTSSTNSRISRALKKQTVASFVSKNAPEFCTVVVVCKGQLQSTREATKSL